MPKKIYHIDVHDDMPGLGTSYKTENDFKAACGIAENLSWNEVTSEAKTMVVYEEEDGDVTPIAIFWAGMYFEHKEI